MPAARDSLGDYLRRNEMRENVEKEMATLDILLTTKIGRTALTLDEYIKVRLAQGTAINIIKNDLLEDLEIGGRIFGEFNKAVTATFKGSVNRFRDGAFESVLGKDIDWMWVAVLINTCEDCLDRHGQIKSMAEWEKEGLPRTGATVCKENCKCVLMPSEVAVLKPIYRNE